MSTNRFASVLLVVGSLAGVLTMVLHPTGADVVHNASAGQSNGLSGAVHLLALLAQPLLLAGVIMLIPAIGRSRELVVTGTVFFAMASVAVMIAATASGFIAPGTLADYASADPTKRAMLLNVFHYTGLVNQAFALLYAAFAASAILLWSIAILSGGGFPRGLGMFGAFYSVLILLGAASLRLRLDIHGFGALVLGQSIWFITAAVQMWRRASVKVSAS